MSREAEARRRTEERRERYPDRAPQDVTGAPPRSARIPRRPAVNLSFGVVLAFIAVAAALLVYFAFFS